MTITTVMSRPICPNSWPYQAVNAALMTPSTIAAGAVPSSTSAPPTTTVTKASTIKVIPIIGISVIVGANNPPVNPWGEELWSGASSSGSGAATAAGLCFGSLGSDTGGSIRFPCYANHLIGLKPTWGRVSRHGVFPLSDTLDHVGPMTRRVEDAAAMLGAIAGRDELDPTSLPGAVPDYLASIDDGVAGLRIGYDERYCSEGIDTPVFQAIARGLDILKGRGASIVPVTLPDTREAVAHWGTLCAVEAALAHGPTYPERKRDYSAGYAEFLDSGQALSGVDYARATIVRHEFRGAVAALFASVDLYIAPIMWKPVPTAADGRGPLLRLVRGVVCGTGRRPPHRPPHQSGGPDRLPGLDPARRAR